MHVNSQFLPWEISVTVIFWEGLWYHNILEKNISLPWQHWYLCCIIVITCCTICSDLNLFCPQSLFSCFNPFHANLCKVPVCLSLILLLVDIGLKQGTWLANSIPWSDCCYLPRFSLKSLGLKDCQCKWQRLFSPSSLLSFHFHLMPIVDISLLHHLQVSHFNNKVKLKYVIFAVICFQEFFTLLWFA